MFTIKKSLGALCRRSSFSLCLKKANPTAHIVRMASFCAMLILLVTSAHAGTIFVAPMSGTDEVPSNASTNIGTATFELNDDETELTYNILVQTFDVGGVLTPDVNDDITGLHLHNAPPGVNGGVVFGIFNPSQDADRTIKIETDGRIRFTGVWDAGDPSNDTLANQIANLKNGDVYVNLHNAAFPGGEIRGNLVPEPSTACLFGVALLGFGILRRRR